MTLSIGVELPIWFRCKKKFFFSYFVFFVFFFVSQFSRVTLTWTLLRACTELYSSTMFNEALMDWLSLASNPKYFGALLVTVTAVMNSLSVEDALQFLEDNPSMFPVYIAHRVKTWTCSIRFFFIFFSICISFLMRRTSDSQPFFLDVAELFFRVSSLVFFIMMVYAIRRPPLHPVVKHKAH